MNRCATVVGAGVAGLASAAFLARRGWCVTVRERRADAVATAGTALVLRHDVVRALAVEGVADIREHGAVLRRLTVAGRSGTPRLVQRFPPGREAVSLSRPALLDLLQPLLRDVALRTGDPVSPADLPQLRATADLVVIADGVFSALRPAALDGDSGARFRHSSVWRGTVPGEQCDLTEFWSGGARFGISARDGGVTNWYATVRSATPLAGTFAPRDHRRLLDHVFRGWNPRIDEVLASLDVEAVLHHDVYDVGPLESYAAGQVALVGDAAHGMTPDLGRGAAEAILDARCLAESVSSSSAAAGARRYDRARRRRTQRVAVLSRAVGRIVHRRGGRP